MPSAPTRRAAWVRRGLTLALASLVAGVGVVAYLIWGDPAWVSGHARLAEVAEHVRDGRLTRTADFVVRYGLGAACANILLIAALRATVRWWLRPGPVPECAAWAPPRGGLRPAFAALTAAAMLCGALLAHTRLSQSFWDDEVGSLRTAIHGRYRVDEAGGARFEPARWTGTLWGYHNPNNHIPYSALARASTSLWRTLVGAGPEWVNEASMRVPAYLAGIASIGSAALLLWRIGLPWAGVLAAWLLAIHPWHMRYASEGRGYTLLMLLTTASLTLLVGALHRGSWPRWVAFGAAQFLLLWTYPAAILQVAIPNAVAGLAIWRARATSGEAVRQLLRLAVVGLGGAILWLQLMAPNVAQLVAYIDSQPFPPIEAATVRRFGSFLLAGMPWGSHAQDPAYPELSALAAASPARVWTAVTLACALLATGTARLLRAGGPRSRLTWALLLPGPITLLFSWLRNQYMFEQYLIFALPGAAILVSVGVASSCAPVGAGRTRRALAAGVALAFLAAFFGFTQPARTALRTRSLQPMRESVELSRGLRHVEDPENDRILTASFYHRPRHYDPFVLEIERPGELRALMARADAEDRTLYLNIARIEGAKRDHPELTRLALDPEFFEEIATLPAFERKKTRHVFRYRGARDAAR